MPTRTPRRVPIRRPLVAAALVTLAASAGVAAIGQTSEAAPQQATITVLPGIVQPGKKVANADKALSAVIATFSPAKKGRTVELQKKVGSKWVEVATGVQDRTGKVEFAAPSGSAAKPDHLPGGRRQELEPAHGGQPRRRHLAVGPGHLHRPVRRHLAEQQLGAPHAVLPARVDAQLLEGLARPRSAWPAARCA